jgi:putative Ca2+/H+ antiporter (TMEM165/GDT1 family)
MGSAADASATWVGATLALATTSVLGVYAGRRLLNRLPLRWIHRISGIFFLILALLAGLRLIGAV